MVCNPGTGSLNSIATACGSAPRIHAGLVSAPAQLVSPPRRMSYVSSVISPCDDTLGDTPHQLNPNVCEVAMTYEWPSMFTTGGNAVALKRVTKFCWLSRRANCTSNCSRASFTALYGPGPRALMD